LVSKNKPVRATKGQSQKQAHQASLLEVTIFTHDDMMFADATNVEGHRKGVDKFFKTVHRLVQQKKLHSVQLIVMESNCNIRSSVARRVHQHHATSSDESDGEEEDASIHSHSRDMTEVKAQALTLLTNIQRQLQTLSASAAAASAAGNSTKHSEQESVPAVPLSTKVNVNVKVMECTHVEYNSLARQWLRSDVGSVQIKFDLPETIDGSICALMLDLEYKVFPCRLQSSEGQAMVNFARSLDTQRSAGVAAGFDFDVVQLIQNENVDAGLIYGNAMVARAAVSHHEEIDEDADAHANAAAQQEEMKLLASQVWKWLRQQDCAMLLKATPIIANSHEGQEEEELVTLSEEEEVLMEPQYFLLMSEAAEGPYSSGGNTSGALGSLFDDASTTTGGSCSSSTGMLFRYAADDHLLLDGTEEDAERTMHDSGATVTSTPPAAAGGESSSPSNHQHTHQTQNNATTAAHHLAMEELEEAKTQYYDHVDTALTTLLCAPVNPLLPTHILKTPEWS
jgi:hypothetical protein